MDRPSFSRRLGASLRQVLLGTALLVPSAVAEPGRNDLTHFVLHARSGPEGACDEGDLPDCEWIRPRVEVEPNQEYRVYLFLNHVISVAGVQTAFEWDPGWVLDPNGHGVSWLPCQSNQLTVVAPEPGTNGGPTAGTLTTAFDCVTSSSLVPIGRMEFRTGPSGCLRQVQSAYPFGNHVVDCQQGQEEFDPECDPSFFGKICVGPGGYDACDIVFDPRPPFDCWVGGPYSGAVGDTIRFEGYACCAPSQYYSWDFGDGSYAQEQFADHVYEAPGLYTVRFTAAGRCGAYCSASTTADIGPVPVELSRFTATPRDGRILLRWQTARAEDLAGFEVLRAPGDGGAYRSVSGAALLRDEDGDGEFAFEDRTVEPGATYLYLLEAEATNGDRERFGPFRVTVLGAAPEALAVHAPFPNPFTPPATITLDLPAAGEARVRIYDATGRLVRVLASTALDAGSHTIPWDGRDDRGSRVGSGIYVVRVEADGRAAAAKIAVE